MDHILPFAAVAVIVRGGDGKCIVARFAIERAADFAAVGVERQPAGQTLGHREDIGSAAARGRQSGRRIGDAEQRVGEFRRRKGDGHLVHGHGDDFDRIGGHSVDRAEA